MKKLYFILLIVLCIITVGLFPLDLFIFTVPEWVIYVMLAAVIAAAVLVFVKAGAKAPVKAVSVCLAAVTVLGALGGIIIDPYFNGTWLHLSPAGPSQRYDTVLSADRACADLDCAMKYLQKCHPALMDGLPAGMRQKYEQAKADIKAAGSVTVNELARQTEGIFTMLNDAHTNAFVQDNAPLYLKHYYKWKQGDWKLTALNGITLKELLARSTELYSFEAESWELECMKNDLLNLRGLDYLGFSPADGVEYTFENPDGEQRSETYYTADYVTYAEYLEFNGITDQPADTGSFVSYDIDEDRSLAVLTLSECIYNSEYINCLRDMFTEVKEKGIRNVAVDLRDNGGGNDRTATEFIRYLDTDGFKYASEYQRLGFLTTPRSADYAANQRYSGLTFTGDLYILMSSGSFSSAMLFPQYIKDNGLGTLIGEPPGNDPNGYGEITMFVLPESGIRLSISTKRFFRADRDCPDKYIMPDIPCEAADALDTLYNTISAQ